jgi:cytochrome b6-f complex iron-sulfur subunit
MTRKEFFAKAGFGAAALLVPACIAGVATSCSKDGASPTPTPNLTPTPTPTPVGVNFTLDITQSELASDGGYIITKGNIIVARVSTTEYIAVSSVCTHEGGTIFYDKQNVSFYCSNLPKPPHESKFSKTGSVTKGPATASLKQYKTSINGNILTITS